MDLDELRSAQSRERQASQLQHLRDGFYEEAASFIRGLRTERERAAANTDYSFPYDDPEVQRLTNEIQTAEEVVESLYERRVGKVVKMASFDAAGMAVDAEGLTAEESDLFETLVGDIEANRERVLDALAGTSGDGPGPGTSAGGSAGGSAETAEEPPARDAPREEATRADAAPGDRDPDAAPAEDGPVHIGSGPAADGPVSTADEDADSRNAPPSGQAPTPAAEDQEPVASPSETTSDATATGPSQESHGGSAAPGRGRGDADQSDDAMDAASAMGGVTDDAGADALGQPDDRAAGSADANRSTGGASEAPPEARSTATDPAGSADPTPTADATADTADTDATADTADSPTASGTEPRSDEGHQPVPPADGPPGTDPTRSADSTSAEQPASGPGSASAAGGASGTATTDAQTGSDGSTAPADGANDSGATGTLVRVTADVGEIFGVDGRSYDLAAGDVAVLPTDNAGLLVEGGDAERLDSTIPLSGHSNRS